MEFKSLEHYRKLKDAHASLQLQLQDAHAATGGLENNLSATLADAGATDADIEKARRAIPTHLQNIEQLKHELNAHAAAIETAHAAALPGCRAEFETHVTELVEAMPSHWQGFKDTALALIAISEKVDTGWRELRNDYASWGRLGYGVPPPRIPGRPGTDAQRYTAMLAGTAKTLRVLLNNL